MRLQGVFDDKYFLLGAQSLRPYIVINIYSTVQIKIAHH